MRLLRTRRRGLRQHLGVMLAMQHHDQRFSSLCSMRHRKQHCRAPHCQRRQLMHCRSRQHRFGALRGQQHSRATAHCRRLALRAVRTPLQHHCQHHCRAKHCLMHCRSRQHSQQQRQQQHSQHHSGQQQHNQHRRASVPAISPQEPQRRWRSCTMPRRRRREQLCPPPAALTPGALMAAAAAFELQRPPWPPALVSRNPYPSNIFMISLGYFIRPPRHLWFFGQVRVP